MAPEVGITVDVEAEEAAGLVLSRFAKVPSLALVLGSGLNDYVETLAESTSIPFQDIPHCPRTTVKSHSGRLVIGVGGGVPVIASQGRFHYYEGYSLAEITFPIRLFVALGISTVIMTNAAGCVRRDWNVGEFMAHTGHLDYTFLSSADDPLPETRPLYHDRDLLDAARRSAAVSGITLREGVYAWTLGPSFETPAEIQDVRRLEGDAVGMSTVPEVRVAAEHGLRVLGISCLTNKAAGMIEQPLTHSEVLMTAGRVSQRFTRFMNKLLWEIAGQ
ncbi:purine-nucleoside phosphorylase [Candidatus Neomarinimicrobiota bacterium]